MKLLVGLIISGSVFAAGSGHGSPSDLISSFVNIFLLAGGLLYVLIPKLKVHFGTKSKEVKEIMERAQIKAKEAQMLMETQKKKLLNLDGEIAGIKKEADQEISTYQSNYSKEVEDRISKLKSDAAKKIESEKQELANDLNEQLLDAVIANAKTKIKSDSALNTAATGRILEGLK